jgi:hypothetical protein
MIGPAQIYALPRDAGQVYGPGSHFVRWWRRENHPRTQQTASSFSSSSMMTPTGSVRILPLRLVHKSTPAKIES